MEWNEEGLLNPSTFRGRKKKAEVDGRNAFENDYMRVITNPAFRRLQDKSQVFPLDDSDFVRTRLTHSLEVSAIAESLGASIEDWLIVNKKLKAEFKGHLRAILKTVGVLHDIGNPPFGHYGEYVIQNFFKNYDKHNDDFKNLSEELKSDFQNFDGNVQGLRLATHLVYLIEDKKGDNYGLNLTFATLSSMIKYPCCSEYGNKGKKSPNINQKKFGYFKSESKLFSTIAEEVGLIKINCENGESYYSRHPLAFILEAADDIAYCSSDTEDGFKKGVISIEYLKDILINTKETAELNEPQKKYIEKLLSDIKEIEEDVKGYKHPDEMSIIIKRISIYTRSLMIEAVINSFKENYESIMEGKYDKELLLESDAKGIRLAYKKISEERIFTNKNIIEKELAGGKIIESLLTIFVEAMVEEENSRTMRLKQIISDDYKYICKKIKCSSKEEELYCKLLTVTDFICGMTDSYALNLYQKIIGIKI